MKLRNMALAALGITTMVGATLTLTLNSNAQGGGTAVGQGVGPPAGPRGGQGVGGGQGFPGGPPGGPGQQGQFPGGQGGPGQFRPGMGGFGGGGGSAMDSDSTFLYVVQGNTLFKIAKGDLRVIGSVQLTQGPPGGEFAAPASGARRGGGQGTGVQNPPPPSK